MSPGDSATPGQVGSSRLVPDFAAENPYRPLGESANADRSPTPLTSDDARFKTFQLQPKTGADAAVSPYATAASRARLRDEAPRPLDFAARSQPAENAVVPTQYPRTDAAVTAASATNVEAVTPPVAVPPENWDANHYASSVASSPPNAPSTTTVSYDQPVAPAFNQVLITAPPWPAPSMLQDDEHGPRKHIVMDGDSLEKLAGRYLDDPKRAAEIFEANRERLTSPDLLPIGAELVIPDRINPSAPNPFQSQSSAEAGSTIRAASHLMVPVRPIPPTASVMPRAQLLPPRAVE
jgi:nucleoid-associated protein YgaU